MILHKNPLKNQVLSHKITASNRIVADLNPFRDDSFEQHKKSLSINFIFTAPLPHKRSFLEPLKPNDQAILVPEKYLYLVLSAVEKNKQCTR